MPKVSVNIISYNNAKFVRRAIDSVLSQTFKDYEIIFVDDGSTDNTAAIVQACQGAVRYIYQENLGIPVARNRGILASQGEYIALLDADDYWVPNKLELQVAILDRYKNVGFVYSKIPVVNEEGQQKGVWPHTECGRNFYEIIEKGAFSPNTTVMVRKECFVKVGLFDPVMPPVEDIDIWLRIARYYQIYEIQDTLLGFYYREDNKPPRDKIKLFTSQVRLYRKLLYSYDQGLPVHATKQQLAKFQYLLGKAYYEKRSML